MIDAAKAGFRSSGFGSTSFADVLQRSGAARGAIYHHFPGGRHELTLAVMQSTSDGVAEGLEGASESPASPVEVLMGALDALCESVERHNGGFGCPITPAVLEAAGDRELLAAGDAAFQRWQEVLVDRYGLDREQAALVVASVEGALVMCRAARTSEPLRRITDALHANLGATSEREEDR